MEFRSLCLEQQIQNEEEIRTPPRREPRRAESLPPKGPRQGRNQSASGPGYMAAQQMNPAGRHRLYSEWSPVETLESTVSRMQRDLENLQTENRFLRTRRTTGPVSLVRQAALATTKVPWFSGSTSWEQYQQVFDAIVLSNGCDCGAAVTVTSAGRGPKCGIVNYDGPPGFQEGTDRHNIVSLWIARSVGKLPLTVRQD